MINYVKENIKFLAIAGDGQLARFLALSAQKYHLKCKFLSLNATLSPCLGLGEIFEISDWNNSKQMDQFLVGVDALILENEFISTELLQLAQQKKILCLPNLSSYAELDNKYKQCQLARENNFLTPHFNLINNLDEIDFSTPHMLKAIKQGYDGYGNLAVDHSTPREQIKNFIQKYKNILVQEFINFDFEFSLIAARDSYENIIFFPTAKTIQENNICHFVESPAHLPIKLINDIKNKISNLLNRINATGLFAFEFFYKEGEVYFNEIAPRPHNSGHFTLDNCDYSQFDALIKILLKQALSEPKLIKPAAVMLNLLGTQQGYADFKIKNKNPVENMSLHLYQKKYSKQGRKMGHITVIGDDPQVITQQLQHIKENYTL